MNGDAQFVPKNVLVFGATGLIGREIFKKLIEARSLLERLVIFTSPNTEREKSEELSAYKAKGVEIVVGDIRKENDVLRAYEGLYNPSSHSEVLLKT